MPVHADVQFVLNLIDKVRPPEFWELAPEAARVQFDEAAPKLDAPPAPMAAIEDRRVPVDGGEIPIRLYWPPPW